MAASIGFQGADVQGPLGILAVQLRDACITILQEWEYINSLGIAGLEAAPYNMVAADATTLFNTYNYLQTVAQLYYGTAAQPAAFNFNTQLALARGGR